MSGVDWSCPQCGENSMSLTVIRVLILVHSAQLQGAILHNMLFNENVKERGIERHQLGWYSMYWFIFFKLA